MPHDDAPAYAAEPDVTDAPPADPGRATGQQVQVPGVQAPEVQIPASREPSILETAPAAQTVTLAGKVDVRSVGNLRATLHSAIDTGQGPLRVDVAGLELGDDAALGVLLGAHRRARRSGRSMVVVGVSPRSGRPAGLHRLGRVLRIEDDGLLPAGHA